MFLPVIENTLWRDLNPEPSFSLFFRINRFSSPPSPGSTKTERRDDEWPDLGHVTWWRHCFAGSRNFNLRLPIKRTSTWFRSGDRRTPWQRSPGWAAGAPDRWSSGRIFSGIAIKTGKIPFELGPFDTKAPKGPRTGSRLTSRRTRSILRRPATWRTCRHLGSAMYCYWDYRYPCIIPIAYVQLTFIACIYCFTAFIFCSTQVCKEITDARESF